jgi:hypothetical protein
MEESCSMPACVAFMGIQATSGEPLKRVAVGPAMPGRLKQPVDLLHPGTLIHGCRSIGVAWWSALGGSVATAVEPVPFWSSLAAI